MIISNLVSALDMVQTRELKKRVLARQNKPVRKVRHHWKSTTTAVYTGVFLLIVSMVAIGYQPPKRADSVANAVSTEIITPSQSDDTQPSVDQLIAIRVAAGIAERSNLPIARNIAERSTTLSIESELTQGDDNVITKPQIIAPSAGSREIRTYTAVAGDSVEKLAAQFGVSGTTIKWANSLTSDAVEAGRTLQIPRINGVLYTVKAGDTTSSIANKYKADEQRIILDNDLELTGLEAGKKLIIPDGDLPSTERPGYIAPSRRSSATMTYTASSYGSGFGGSSWRIGIGTARNSYAYGNCTAYAYNRRVELGLPVGLHWGNASSWDNYARSAGLVVSNSPSVGAIIQNDGGYGHVGIVEELLPNGDISISEMNAYVPGGGFNIVSGRTVPAGNVRSYLYIR